MKSSRKPTAAQQTVTKRTVSAGSVNFESARNGIDRAEQDQQAAHHRRSLLDHVAGRAVLADRLAELVPAQELDELRPDHDRDDHRDQAGDEDSDHYGVSFARAGAMPSRATERDALTSTASPGRTSGERSRARPLASGSQRLRAVAARELADREHLDPQLVRQLCDLAVVLLRVLAELGHAAEDREPPPARAALGEVTSAACIDVGFAL